ncbi:MAG TPA: hypothetical protein VFS16_19970, partial [Acidimicrobiia bacterium]|nr:hypothetical protein [Acidimicrobiia bacterium]
PEDRSLATAQLVELGVPYRWTDFLVLVVPAAVEAEVDALLDEIDEIAAAGAAPDDGPPVTGDDAGDDGGEEAAGAMGDLFVAADTLQQGVYDQGKVLAFLEAADAVLSTLAPYGIDPPLWERVQDEADAIVAALAASTEGDDDEAVIDAARALRNLLRPYV